MCRVLFSSTTFCSSCFLFFFFRLASISSSSFLISSLGFDSVSSSTNLAHGPVYPSKSDGSLLRTLVSGIQFTILLVGSINSILFYLFNFNFMYFVCFYHTFLCTNCQGIEFLLMLVEQKLIKKQKQNMSGLPLVFSKIFPGF